MKYEEALQYLEETVSRLGSVLGLDTIRELLERTGHPEKELQCIHIAGTNGKGSVGTFLASALSKNGYRIGRYLSPSVLDYREKIQVGGAYIPKTKAAEYLTYLFEIAAAMREDGLPHPTVFEIETAMAFLYFKEKNCDYCIVEVGMGGREDATNIIPSPLLGILTSISLDHVGMIGNTLEEIAKTKAGIIKDHMTVITAPQCDEVRKVIVNECTAHQDVSLHEVKADLIKPGKIKGSFRKALVQCFGYGKYRQAEISLLGEFQTENAAVALEALEALKGLGIQLKDEKILAGLKEAAWPARFEILGKDPLLISDGAHNPDAVERLMKTVELCFTKSPIIYIMGVLKDKAVDEIIALSAHRAAYIFTITPPNNKRGMSAFELAGRIREINPKVTAADSVEEALEEAALIAGKDGVILAFGSLSYQGKLREAYHQWLTRKR